jgi:hypothetical protein
VAFGTSGYSCHAILSATRTLPEIAEKRPVKTMIS